MRKEIRKLIQNDGPSGWRAYYPFTLGIDENGEISIASSRIPKPPIFPSIAFAYPDLKTASGIFNGKIDGSSYTRVSPHPIVRELEALLVKAEFSDGPAWLRKEFQDLYGAVTFSSGMTPEFMLFRYLLKPGDIVLADPRIYGGSYKLLMEMLPQGATVHFVSNPDSWESWEHLFERLDYRGKIKAIFCESFTNPGCIIPNLEIFRRAKKYGVFRVIDNTVETWEYFQPILFDHADAVTYSLSKAPIGNSTYLLGALIARKEIVRAIQNDNAIVGAIPTPDAAWMAQLGIATLQKRMHVHQKNLRILAEMLRDCPSVRKVHCPLLEGDKSRVRLQHHEIHGVGPLISFELSGGQAHAARFIDALSPLAVDEFKKGERITYPIHATHLEDCKTLVTYPRDTTHSAVPKERRDEVSCGDGIIRMSPGMEPYFRIIARNTVQLISKTSS